MPVCTLHLLSLTVPLATFLGALQNSSVKPLTVGRVVRWVITPTSTSTDTLLARDANWDVLVVLPTVDDLPSNLKSLVRKHWFVKAGVPSGLLKDFQAKNDRLLYPKPGDVPEFTGSLNDPLKGETSQTLELSDELQRWVREFSKQEGRGAVSMWNLLSFKPGMKTEYLKYGKAFAQTAGAKRGGNAKIVGTVVEVSTSPKSVKEWDEVAIAHYPSIMHFADMLASEDYQAVNKKHRVPALRDTFILCTTELDLPWPGKQAKL